MNTPSQFMEIAPQPTQVNLSAGASTDIVFTVHNVSRRSLQVEALIEQLTGKTLEGEPLPSAAWRDLLTVDGPSAVDGSQGEVIVDRYTVHVSKQLRPGTYQFCLLIVGIEDPDRDFVHSDPVTVTVTGPEMDMVPIFRWALVAVAVIVLLVIGVIITILIQSSRAATMEEMIEAHMTAAAMSDTVLAGQWIDYSITISNKAPVPTPPKPSRWQSWPCFNQTPTSDANRRYDPRPKLCGMLYAEPLTVTNKLTTENTITELALFYTLPKGVTAATVRKTFCEDVDAATRCWELDDDLKPGAAITIPLAVLVGSDALVIDNSDAVAVRFKMNGKSAEVHVAVYGNAKVTQILPADAISVPPELQAAQKALSDAWQARNALGIDSSEAQRKRDVTADTLSSTLQILIGETKPTTATQILTDTQNALQDNPAELNSLLPQLKGYLQTELGKQADTNPSEQKTLNLRLALYAVDDLQQAMDALGKVKDAENEVNKAQNNLKEIQTQNKESTNAETAAQQAAILRQQKQVSANSTPLEMGGWQDLYASVAALQDHEAALQWLATARLTAAVDDATGASLTAAKKHAVEGQIGPFLDAILGIQTPLKSLRDTARPEALLAAQLALKTPKAAAVDQAQRKLQDALAEQERSTKAVGKTELRKEILENYNAYLDLVNAQVNTAKAQLEQALAAQQAESEPAGAAAAIPPALVEALAQQIADAVTKAVVSKSNQVDLLKASAQQMLTVEQAIQLDVKSQLSRALVAVQRPTRVRLFYDAEYAIQQLDQELASGRYSYTERTRKTLLRTALADLQLALRHLLAVPATQQPPGADFQAVIQQIADESSQGVTLTTLIEELQDALGQTKLALRAQGDSTNTSS